MPRPIEQIAHDLLKNAEQAHELNLELQAALCDQDTTTGGFSSPLQGGALNVEPWPLDAALSRSPL